MVLQKTSKLAAAQPSARAGSLQETGARESSDAGAELTSLKPAAQPLQNGDRNPSGNDGDEEEVEYVGEEFCNALLNLIKVATPCILPAVCNLRCL